MEENSHDIGTNKHLIHISCFKHKIPTVNTEFFSQYKHIIIIMQFLLTLTCYFYSVWNQRKVHKRQGSGFLGCVRIQPSTVHKLKDTGCMYKYHPCLLFN